MSWLHLLVHPLVGIIPLLPGAFRRPFLVWRDSSAGASAVYRCTMGIAFWVPVVAFVSSLESVPAGAGRGVVLLAGEFPGVYAPVPLGEFDCPGGRDVRGVDWWY